MKTLLTATIALATVFAASGSEWYVDPVNGLDTRDGTTSNVVSATVGPRKTLEKAMELVNVGDTLWLLPGEYNEGAMRDGRTRLYVTKSNVKVKSTAGAANTFIVGEGDTAMTSTSSKNCAQVSNRVSGVIFEGITFKDGCGQRHDSIKDNGGGLDDESGDAWAIDCVFTNCYAYVGGGQYKGNALRCRYVDCHVASDGRAVAYGNTFVFCLFQDYDADTSTERATYKTFYPSRFYNCTFYGYGGNALNLYHNPGDTVTMCNSISVGYLKGCGAPTMYATNSVMGSASCVVAVNCVTNVSVEQSGLVSPTEGDFRVTEASATASLGEASLLADIPVPTGYSLDSDLVGNPVPSSGAIPAGCLVETRTCHLYVDCVNGSDSNDGTQANPYKTIHAATDNAISGDVIHVAPGTYGEAEGSQTVLDSGKSRVVVPEGVTLVGTEGPKKTFIVGAAATGDQVDNATYGTGTNAIRCVYAKSGSVVRGFTLTGGRGVGVGKKDKVGCGAAFYSEVTWEGTVENCIVSNNIACFGTIHEATVRNCRVIGNTATASLNYSGSAGSSCKWYGSIIDDNIGDAPAYSPFAFENCTIGTRNVRINGTEAQVLYFNSGDHTLLNSAILGGSYRTPSDGRIWCTNCLVMAAKIGNSLKVEQSYSTIFTNSAAAQVDSAYRPIFGSFVGIDAGEAAYSSATLGDTDIYGTPRILNGRIDIGAVEYDWRPTFNNEIGRHFKLRYASPTVTTNVAGGVKLDGDTGTLGDRAFPVCVAGTVTSAGPYAFTFEMTGGSVQVYVGGVLAGEAFDTGAQSIRFNVPDTTSEIRFTFTPDEQNPSAVILRSFSVARGFIVSFR